VLGVLITIVGLVVYWGRLVVDRGVVDWFVNRGMVNSMVWNFGMVNYGRGSMNSMVNSRGCMVNSMSTKSCEWSSRSSSHKWNKSK